jgi:methyl-accepting chemotaxis protein
MEALIPGKSAPKRLLVAFLALDLMMGVSATISWLANLEVRSVSGIVAACLGLFAVHMSMWLVDLRASLGPLLVWEQRGLECSDAELLAADRAAGKIPVRLAVVTCLAWLLYFAGIAGLTWFVFPGLLSFGQLELSAMGFQFCALALGPPIVVFPLASLIIQETQVRIGTQLGERGLEQDREETPMGPRLLYLALCLVLSTVSWQAATSWLALGEGARALTEERVRDAARWSASEVVHGTSELPAGQELVDFEALPPGLRGEPGSELGEVQTMLEKRDEMVTAAAAVGDGRWVVVHEKVTFERQSYWVGLIASVMALLGGAALAIFGTASSLVSPLNRLRSGLQRVIEVGDLRAVGRIPVVRRDEIGMLTSEFNRMLDVYEELAGAALSVAEGDLRVEISGPGDLQDAFRAMVERLAELVMQIRNAAVEVSSAAAEIHAATREQEQAANQQSEGVREVSVAMGRLEGSAGNISSAANEVLLNARQTRERSDEVVAKISEFGGHITRVGELLELIREVADRSDLLALNGSLEATRAGEAGRGFELVAVEMRRLAERVSQAVADVRATISDIGATNAATVAATESNRELAEGTTSAARRIADATETQSVETEMVSSNVRSIVDLMASSVAATSQTRAAADGLRERAEQLERLIKHFSVKGDEG